MMGRSEDVYIEIERRRRNIGAAVSVMRGIALRRPIALAGLPDDVIVGDPSGFHVRAVEKDTQPLSTFANDSAHVGSLQLARCLNEKHGTPAGAVTAVTR